MSLIGSVGRWHGAADDPNSELRHLRNEANRHRVQITELLAKKRDCAVMISGHYAAIRKLMRRARRLGVSL